MNTAMTRSLLIRGALVAGLLTTAPTVPAKPPVARHTVQAVADVGSDRILVRWLQVEGDVKRFEFHDVLRREADTTEFLRLGNYPVAPARTVAEVEAIFTAPGMEDALAEIVDMLGDDYAGRLLQMQDPAANDDDRARLRLIPDLNYGAAIALGLGILDESVVPGVRYVYEVWGVNSAGLRVERLGRASATAGAPLELRQVHDVACVDRGDVRGDMSVHMRWETFPPDPVQVGHDVYRVKRNPDLTCPPIQPGQPGTQRANERVITSAPAGTVRAGEELFQTYCRSCHGSTATEDPRDFPPSDLGPLLNGVQGSTMHTFGRTRDPNVWGPMPAHQTDPGVVALGADDVQAIYDYIHEFQFRDDGAATPDEPLEEGETYCYEVRPRSIFGHHGQDPSGPGGIEQVECEVQDREPPSAPFGVRSERIVQGSLELCQLSWNRNDEADEDTVAYRVYRMPAVPRLRSQEPAIGAVPLASIAQPAGGARVVHLDATLGTSEMGESWFYGIRAFDDAGNASRFSAWVPCVPRDIVPPVAPVLDPCPVSDCQCSRLGADPKWTAAGGDPDVLMTLEPRGCPVVDCNAPGAMGCRLERSFDGVDYEPGRDHSFPDLVDLDYAPMMDQQVFFQARAYDASGNYSDPSPPTAWLLPGDKPLPAPQIIDVLSANPGPGFVKIRFRSLQPDRLLGFSLHRTTYPNVDPVGMSDYVTHFQDENLGGIFEADPVTDRLWFAKRAGAVSLNFLPGFIRTSDPAGVDEFLYYNDLDQIYVMQVDVTDIDDIVLQLRAIGWTGQEGLGKPFVWDGYQAKNGTLEWPKMRSANTQNGSLSGVLTVQYNGPAQRMELEWTAYPAQPCRRYSEPFIVYRQRQGSAHWHQLSVPFGCDESTAPTVRFRDLDVLPGKTYSYRVVRLDDQGEFQIEYGPVTRVAQ